MSALIKISGDEYTTNLVIPHIISVEEVEKDLAVRYDLFEFKIMVVGTNDFYLFKFKNEKTARTEQLQVLNAIALYYKEAAR